MNQRKLLRRGIFLVGIQLELDKLREYAEIFGDCLTERLEKFSSDLEERASKLTEEEQEELYDFYLDDSWNLTTEFPNTLWASLFTTSYSLVEYELTRLCKYSDKVGNYLVKFDNSKGTDLENAKKYLKQIGVTFPDNALWQKICEYKKLRNIVVHHDGQLNVLKKVEWAGSDAGLSESEKRDLKKQRQAEKFINSNPSLSLHIRNETIQFSKEFCLEVIDTIEKFVKELFKGL